MKKLLVGMGEEGDFFVFDVSTFDKKKKAYMDCSIDCYYEDEPTVPSFSKSIIDTLPEEMKGPARGKWYEYDQRKEYHDKYVEFRKALENAQNDDELDELLDSAHDMGFTDLCICRGGAQFIILEEE